MPSYAVTAILNASKKINLLSLNLSAGVSFTSKPGSLEGKVENVGTSKKPEEEEDEEFVPLIGSLKSSRRSMDDWTLQ